VSGRGRDLRYFAPAAGNAVQQNEKSYRAARQINQELRHVSPNHRFHAAFEVYSTVRAMTMTTANFSEFQHDADDQAMAETRTPSAIARVMRKVLAATGACVRQSVFRSARRR